MSRCLNVLAHIVTFLLTRYLNGDVEARSYNPLPIISALNLVLSQYASRAGVVVGRNRNKFFFPNETFNLGGGLEAWKGYYSSIRPSYKSLMVNLNVATTAFYSEGNLATKVLEWINFSFGARADAFVKGIRVRLTHLGHKKTVNKTARVNARQYKFFFDEANREVTCEEYYKLSEIFLSCIYPSDNANF